MKVEKHRYIIWVSYEELNSNVQIKHSDENSTCIILNIAPVN